MPAKIVVLKSEPRKWGRLPCLGNALCWEFYGHMHGCRDNDGTSTRPPTPVEQISIASLSLIIMFLLALQDALGLEAPSHSHRSLKAVSLMRLRCLTLLIAGRRKTAQLIPFSTRNEVAANFSSPYSTSNFACAGQNAK